MAKYLFSNQSTGQVFVPGTDSYPVGYADILVPGPSNQICVPSNQSDTSINPPLQFPPTGNRISITGFKVSVAGLSGARNFRPTGTGSFVPYLQKFAIGLVDAAGVLVPGTGTLIQFSALELWIPISKILQAPAAAGPLRMIVVQNNLDQTDPAGFGNFEFDSLNVQAIYAGELIARRIEFEVNTIDLLGV